MKGSRPARWACHAPVLQRCGTGTSASARSCAANSLAACGTCPGPGPGRCPDLACCNRPDPSHRSVGHAVRLPAAASIRHHDGQQVGGIGNQCRFCGGWGSWGRYGWHCLGGRRGGERQSWQNRARWLCLRSDRNWRLWAHCFNCERCGSSTASGRGHAKADQKQKRIKLSGHSASQRHLVAPVWVPS